MGFIDTAKEVLRGYSDEEKKLLLQVRDILGEAEYKTLKKLVADDDAQVISKSLRIPGVQLFYPWTTGEGSTKRNELLADWAHKQAYERFPKAAFEALTNAIAPGITGMVGVKQAVVLQLFAQERLHILLLGDPGTGKTEILRVAQELSPISSMGLGSGTSKAGLSVMYVRGEMHKGLLAQAHEGLSCIDELNLMKKEDRAALYNAMQNGFITYDKRGRHERIEADVRVLATANPKGDRFDGHDVEELKKQLPFDPALLSRFHLVFLVRKPGVEEFANIAKSIVQGNKTTEDPNIDFYKAYVKHAQNLDVQFPAKLEKHITAAARTIKEHENELLIEVSPRLVKGIIGFCEASARMELRRKVTEKDVERVLKIFGDSLGLEL